ncbi:hypothetical protein CH286_21085 [Rhodococcus sp. WWJCD1]|nr:hypothetical protein CH286_21085 [Rhodococcus sp. WWJCD1]
MTSARYRHEVLPLFRLCTNSFAGADLEFFTTSGTESNHRHHNQQAAGSTAVHHAELSERFVAPPAARVNVVVAVFTFALIHCASAAAGEHLPTSAPLAVTPRVVKRSRRGATVVTLSPSVRYSTGSPSATHRIEHFQIARHADRHAVQSRTGHRQQRILALEILDVSA